MTTLATPFQVRGKSPASTLRTAGRVLRGSSSTALGPEVPSSRLVIAPTLWRRGRPMLSGEAALDRNYGFRGLVAALNHGWAYRVREIAAGWPEDDAPFTEASSAGVTEYTKRIPFQWSKGVVFAVLHVYCDDVDPLILRVHAGSQTDSAGLTTAAAAALSDVAGPLVNQAGVDGWAQILYTRSGTVRIWGFQILEVALSPPWFT